MPQRQKSVLHARRPSRGLPSLLLPLLLGRHLGYSLGLGLRQQHLVGYSLALGARLLRLEQMQLKSVLMGQRVSMEIKKMWMKMTTWTKHHLWMSLHRFLTAKIMTAMSVFVNRNQRVSRPHPPHLPPRR